MSKDKKTLENICRLDKNFPGYQAIIQLHVKAVKNNEEFYIDPITGFKVFTSLYLHQRGFCCGSGCRHCPY